MDGVEMGKPRRPPQAKGRSNKTPLVVRVLAGVAVAVLLLWAGSSLAGGAADSGAAAPAKQAHAGPQGASRSSRSSSKDGSNDGSKVSSSGQGAGTPPELFTYRIVKEFPHNPQAFTQGLQFDRVCPEGGGECRDVLWESTGLNGQSSVREVELETGRVVRLRELPHQDFGEGLTRLGDRLYQVTWQTPRAWSYAVHNFSDARLLRTPLRDGWGITSDGRHLVVGDSSERLFFLDPDSLQSVRSIRVTDGGEAVRWLNELEWVEGQVLANVWMTECIARIDPATGAVTAWADLKGIKQRMLEGMEGAPLHTDVLNGIAWDEQGRRLFVTGKLWPRLYQVELVPLEAADKEAELRRVRQQCIIRDTSLLGF